MPLTAPSRPAAQTNHLQIQWHTYPLAEPPPTSAKPTHHPEGTLKPTGGGGVELLQDLRREAFPPSLSFLGSPEAGNPLLSPSAPVLPTPLEHTKLKKSCSWEGLKHPPHLVLLELQLKSNF